MSGWLDRAPMSKTPKIGYRGYQDTYVHHFHGHNEQREGGGIPEERLEFAEAEQGTAQFDGLRHGVNALLFSGARGAFATTLIVHSS